MQYYFLITRNGQDEIISIYSPDIDKNLLSQTTAEQDNYVTKATEALLHEIPLLRMISTPKDYNRLSQYPIIPSLQSWEIFEIEFKNTGCFARVMPGLGNLATLLTILTSCCETFIAFRTASSKGLIDDRTSFYLSVSSSLIGSIFGLIIYMYSDATSTLRYIGQDIDNALLNAGKFGTKICTIQCATTDCNIIITNLKSIKFENIQNTLSNCDKRAFFNLLFSLLINGTILTSTGIGLVTAYQEKIGLIERYLNSQSFDNVQDKEREREILIWLIVYIALVASVYSSLSFTLSFVNKFVGDVKNSTKNKQCCNGMFFKFRSDTSNTTQSSNDPDATAGLLAQQGTITRHKIKLS
jgi:hypothetical protein